MTAFSNFRKFFENKKALELKIIIFENSSPKGILRQIINDVPKWSLSQDSQCSQAGALKSTAIMNADVGCEAYVSFFLISLDETALQL